ncbi:MAG: 4Fe-4S dicluster domain-containing protein [Candidatus Hydrogenedentes bacterium]|nr:4Fe-4S dicluster domain-containing protein [Candidatus Hydrogenedentota bacterium]
MLVVERVALDALLDAIRRRGYKLIGPRVRGQAVIFDAINDSRDLPIGVTVDTAGGEYQLVHTDSPAVFSCVTGPQGLKKHFYPARKLLWRAKGSSSDFRIETEPDAPVPCAFIGVRPCDLAALHIQDKIFMEGAHVDPTYRARREQVFIVAVNCAQPAATCFCGSMGTGPRAEKPFDLAVTEVIEGEAHYFCVETGSQQGVDVLRSIPHREPVAREVVASEQVIAAARQQMGREMNTRGIQDLLYRNAEHPQWEGIARRCLGCANCTLVCPTCFCSTVEDVTNLSGDTAERYRVWDSCYTMDFSYIHGGSVRKSGSARYRHWITHKLASWHDQFGVSGCVGCGRCIAWCPVGIDLTEEIAALRSRAIAGAAWTGD